MDRREAEREARYCLNLKERKRVRMMTKPLRWAEHKMLPELLELKNAEDLKVAIFCSLVM